LQRQVGDFSLGSPPCDQAAADAKIQKALAEGPQVFEWVTRKKNAELFWTEVSLKSTRIGGAQRALAVVRDLDDRRRVEKALQE
jgi:PAS domain S-box-containing protein